MFIPGGDFVSSDAELLILGSSAGVPTANRYPTAMALKTGGGLYLLDCGAPVSNHLKRMGEDPRTIRAVFLTHWHPDHAHGLPMLLQDLQLTGRREPLTIYGPPGTSEKLDDLLRLFLIPREILPYTLTAVDVQPGAVFTDEHLRVAYFPTRHLAADQWQTLDDTYGQRLWPLAFGLLLQVADQRILISGDIRSSEDLEPYVEGCSLVSHEFGHMVIDQIRHFAIKHKLPRLLIAHLHHRYDHADGEAEIRAAIADGYEGELLVARDLMRIAL
jgi:ribonuclease BN (tRNA processing enzyme)